MTASEFAEKAKEAFLDDEFILAVDLYSKAIDFDPNNPDFFVDRAQANIKLNNFTEAVADANKAIELDPMMAKAYLRKGIACLKLEEYHTAKAALETGASIAQSDSRFNKLIKECDELIAEETKDLAKPLMPNPQPTDAPAPQAVTLIKPKYRHEYYQKPEEVIVTIFAKGIPAKNLAVDFGEQILSVTIDVPGEDAYHLQPRLFGKIIPEKCRFEVMSTKIEIRLAKAEVFNWTSLEYRKEIVVPQKLNVSSVGSQRPSYPSSKSKTRDWDKLEAQVKKEEKEEKLEGDAGLNKLFRDIFQNADEDTRRAMNKSFLESHGTVLSTDWKDVGSKKVEGSAPEGMEMKKWEY
ncbi:TPR_1 domain-containing protein/CS domain-containing protein/SGS domain-containing protein/TPR_11 domain-containing protein [Cephalotus follicularis]|uniref:TPR_1 domain-containing protein/CS domain-containing protein/SGS domain-containing protein/TPR_11 domain-containing protein n=1 Tax=Cephalotus follicularis TaxID=3775 RepID=A0A1Q3C770_CEPFO|nr:TPR_1 domain-containing protein/CS domain-containing protein/SGS domain-containing protein/TPR_11 domain-containing protein [Cephalotus follicularis]